METVSALLADHRWIPHTKASDAQLWCCPLICAWINGWVKNREPGDVRRHCAHYDVTVMTWTIVHAHTHKSDNDAQSPGHNAYILSIGRTLINEQVPWNLIENDFFLSNKHISNVVCKMSAIFSGRTLQRYSHSVRYRMRCYHNLSFV